MDTSSEGNSLGKSFSSIINDNEILDEVLSGFMKGNREKTPRPYFPPKLKELIKADTRYTMLFPDISRIIDAVRSLNDDRERLYLEAERGFKAMVKLEEVKKFNCKTNGAVNSSFNLEDMIAEIAPDLQVILESFQSRSCDFIQSIIDISMHLEQERRIIII